MKTLRRLCTILGVLVITAAALGLVLVSTGGAAALAAPAELVANLRPAAAPPPVRPLAAPLPATTCTLVGQTRTCEVWAMTGTATMPDGVVVNIWGFTDSATGTAELPGPTLVVSEGERVEVILHNTLAQNVALSFPGQSIFPPDLVGVGQGLSTTYAFTATNPGTYLYEAGLTADGARQVAMGLYGGLIVRPATAGQAYNDAVSAYDDEALLVFSEIDPAFNADPMAFSMQDFSPQYWLINGKAFADTENIGTTAGNRVLLRMINGGIDHRSISLLGLRQTIVGMDAVSLPVTRTWTVVAESIGPGQAVDSIAQIPTSAVTGTLYTIFNGALQNHNADTRLGDGSLAFGGMLTFVEVTSSAQAVADGGPVVTSAEAVPSPTTGGTDVALTFVLSATNGGTVVSYRMAVGAVPTDTGTAIVPPASVVTVTETVPAAQLGLWASDYYEFYVSGQDNEGVWGPVGSAVLNLDKLGPDVVGLSLLPNPTNGTRSLMLRGTADDHTNGNSAVTGATYAIGAGAPQAMALNLAGEPIVEISAQIPVSALAGLAEGQHAVSVVATDGLGNLTDPVATITLSMDLTGPDAGAVTLTPNTLDLSGPPPVNTVRLDGQVSDPASGGVQSSLSTAEGFIDVVGQPGTGFPLFPADGLFDEPTEDVYFPMPVVAFAYLSQGDHAVYIRGRDAAGNWGNAVSGTITIDRNVVDTVGPAVTNLSVDPTPTRGQTDIALLAAATDYLNLSNIAGAEWFVVPDPGYGNGTALTALDGAFDETSEQLQGTIDVTTWRNGYHRIWVRALDAAGNWGASQDVWLRVSGNPRRQVFAANFDAGLLGWTETVGTVTTTPDAQIDGGVAIQSLTEGMGMAATVAGLDPAYVSLDIPLGERGIDLAFDYDPNSTAMAQSEHDILVGVQPLPTGDLPIFGIQVEGTNEQYEVRGWVRDNGATVYTEWIDIPNGPVKLGLTWEADAYAEFVLTVDGTEATLPVPPDTAVYLLRKLHLGPSANLYAELSGTEYFDNFLLERTLYTYLPLVVK